MPFPLPLKRENVFSSYDHNFLPGYGGFVPKLQSRLGETYGNATLGLLSYEPGQPKSPRLTLTQSKALYNPQVPRHLLNRTYGHPEISTYAGQVQKTNIKNGYFYPRDGKYYFALKNYVYDNNPEATSAIQTIEELKRLERMQCKRSDMIASWRTMRPPPPVASEGIKPPTSCNFLPLVCFGPTFDPCPMNRMEMFQSQDQNQMDPKPTEQHSRIIYRSDSALSAGYSGFIPGQQYKVGKNWSRSTFNALGVGKKITAESPCPTF
ncbi:protein FAM166B-like [Amblyraja radiata]|uniref:protein FAM166B-like n=1 Tax=Amblyraja radiata TaxID=386614 RepID=UPI001402FC31|nr:protein FAM166B-like [Amblyraja radiata]